MSNYCYSFLATDVVKTSNQKLDATEDLSVHLLTQNYVKELLVSGEIMQILHAAHLWKYFCLNGK